MDVSGFIKDLERKQLYPVSTSRVGNFSRCGPHRAKFIAESVWDLKTSLKSLNSDLLLRVGEHNEVVEDQIKAFQDRDIEVGAVWMTGLVGSEELEQERKVSETCEALGVECKIWPDVKYFIDDRDLNFQNPDELPNVFTNYMKSVEPLREKPRPVLPAPTTLPSFPEKTDIALQFKPFVIPEDYDELEEALVEPVKGFLKNMPPFPPNAVTAHPFKGGEQQGQERLAYVVREAVALRYKDTRNGLLGNDFSTKFSAYLAQGSLTARQIHHTLVGYEDGTDERFRGVEGFGKGENDGTKAVRQELLWRDYMRLYHRDIGKTLFQAHGVKQYKDPEKKPQWKTSDGKRAAPDQNPSPAAIGDILQRFLEGTTGMGLIDASQRELLHTGYTSNRARQNVANFLAKHLNIDWRYGAEWYEMLLIDYDVSSNWANWQYVSGVGNDPRSESRFFNPVKQAFDYDPTGEYVRAWVPEVCKLEKLENVFQASTASEEDLKKAGLEGNVMVLDPVKRIEFTVEGKPKTNKRPHTRRRGRGPRGTGGSDDKDGSGDHDEETVEQHTSSASLGGLKDRSAPRDLKKGWRSQPSPSDSSTTLSSRSSAGSTDKPRSYHGTPLVVSSPQRQTTAAAGPNHHRAPSFNNGNSSRGGRGGFVRGSAGVSNYHRSPGPNDYTRDYTAEQSRFYRPAHSPSQPLHHSPTEHRGPASRSSQTAVQPGYSRN
jgi:deoxyribodipyrimidine photo-lyase